MKNVLLTLLFFSTLFLSVACHQKTTDWLNGSFPEQQQAIDQTIHAIFESAKAKDMLQLDAYHLYGPKFTKYDDGEYKPRIDAAMGRQKENELFSSIDSLEVKISDLKVDVFGQVAIATFTADYSARFEGQPLGGKDRATMVFVEDAGKWKVTHEHFSTW